ncbi:hypothetical protein MPER_05679 [Moniliophthora perniciosa FA553]|nr:hypothetical protein MPER_05679 [Moniliophthora perniciosa FA553]
MIAALGIMSDVDLLEIALDGLIPFDPITCCLLDSVAIEIKGQFKPLHSAASADPIYLFIGPFEWEDVDGMGCLKCPLDGSFAHWSLDPDGPGASVDADEHGLPQLEQEFSIGVRWDPEQYKVIEEYLRFKQYDPYSTAYAEDKGYPLLMYRNIGPEVDRQSVLNDEASSDGRDGIDVASHRSNQRRTKKIGSKIRRFVDSFARRKKHY